MSEITENTRRLRAVVRVFMSPGIWLVLAAQILFLVVINMGSPEAVESQPSAFKPFIIMVLFMLVLFLISGAFRSIAKHQEPVSVGQIFANAVAIFNKFLLLSFKTLGLLMVLVIFLYSTVLGGLDMETNKAVLHQFSLVIGIAAVVLNFIFIYWLPIVFVSDNFDVLPTLLEALRVARKRLAQAGFVALLVFIPAGLSLAMPSTISLPVIIAIGVVGQLTGWIAYVYCAEFIAQNRSILKLPQSPD